MSPGIMVRLGGDDGLASPIAISSSDDVRGESPLLDIPPVGSVVVHTKSLFSGTGSGSFPTKMSSFVDCSCL